MEISIKAIEKTDLSQMVQLQAESFAEREPATLALGVSKEQFAELIYPDLLKAIKNGYAIGAFDGSKLIGFVFCSDSDSSEPLKIAEEFQALNYAFEKIDAPLNNEPYIGKRMLHIETIGVDKEYTRQGIGSDLVKKTVEFAKKNNFQYIYAECTNFRSRKAMLNNGLKIIYEYQWRESEVKEFKNIDDTFSLQVKAL